MAKLAIRILVRGDVFPNPACDRISFDEELDARSWSIYDLQGRKYLSGRTLDKNSVEIDALPEGTYLLKLGNGDSYYVSRPWMKVCR